MAVRSFFILQYFSKKNQHGEDQHWVLNKTYYVVNFLHKTKKIFQEKTILLWYRSVTKNFFFKFRIKLRWLVGYRHCWSLIWYSFWKWPYCDSYNNLAWHFLAKNLAWHFYSIFSFLYERKTFWSWYFVHWLTTMSE